MTVCKMGRLIGYNELSKSYFHKDDYKSAGGTHCAESACTSRAPRTDSERLDWLFSNDSEDCSEILKGMDTGYYECLDDGRVRLREAIDAAMDREGERNG